MKSKFNGKYANIRYAMYDFHVFLHFTKNMLRRDDQYNMFCKTPTIWGIPVVLYRSAHKLG